MAWLSERLRCGEVTRDQVALAAYLGSQAARAVWDPGEPPSDGPSLVEAISDLAGLQGVRRRGPALVVVEQAWSGPGVMARRRFEKLAGLLQHLAPNNGIHCYCLLPAEFTVEGQAQIAAWVGESLGAGVAGEPAWIAEDQIVSGGHGQILFVSDLVSSAYLSMHLSDQAFVQEVVTQFGLDL